MKPALRACLRNSWCRPGCLWLASTRTAPLKPHRCVSTDASRLSFCRRRRYHRTRGKAYWDRRPRPPWWWSARGTATSRESGVGSATTPGWSLLPAPDRPPGPRRLTADTRVPRSENPGALSADPPSERPGQ